MELMKQPAIAAGLFFLVILLTVLTGCAKPQEGTPAPVTLAAQPAETVTIDPEVAGTATVQDPVNPTAIAGKGNKNKNPPTDGPVTITIHSARKVLGLGTPGKIYLGADPGDVFLILNITVKNTDDQDYNFTSNSIVVRNIERNTRTSHILTWHTAIKKSLDNLLLPPVILGRDDTVTGQVLFQTNDSEDYMVTLVDANRSGISSRPVDFHELLTTRNPVTVTINNVSKVSKFPDTAPMPGHIFLVLNVTIHNTDLKNGFPLALESMDLTDLRTYDYAPHSLNNGPNLMKNFAHPVGTDIMIGQNNSVSGQIIFGIADAPEYRLNLMDANRTIIATRIVRAG